MPAHEPNTHNSLRHLCTLSVLIVCGLVLVGFAAPEESTAPPVTPAVASTAVDECVLTFLTGRTLTGLLMRSDEESVVLRINGIDTTYRRARIASIKFLPPIEERYKKLRASMPDSDIDGRLMLVDWLRDRRAYGLAIVELDSILELEPNHPHAKLLKTWLEQHLKLAQSRKNKDTPKTRTVSRISKSTIPLLTEEQVNLIRVYEIDLNDPPRLKIEDSTIRALIARSPSLFPTDEREREAIFKWSDLEKLKLLFRHKARDLYPEIRVLEDPASFNALKKQIAGRTGWLINGCATARCHGGENAGRFRLSNRNPNSPQTLYTNFLVLDRFVLADGTPLIDHTDPDRSALVHMGMVRSRSLYPHPDVDATEHGRDWRAVFRSTKATNFTRTTDWIRSLYSPRPDYGFEYPPPPSTPPLPEPEP